MPLKTLIQLSVLAPLHARKPLINYFEGKKVGQ
jgi:hypothetical protein